MPILSTDRAKVNYQVWGELQHAAKVITLINGYTRGLSDFRGMVKSLEGRGFVLVSLDNRGSGATEAQVPFSLEDMATDVVTLWRDLGITRSAVLGISMGGLIAQLVLARARNQVTELLLVSTSPSAILIGSDEVPWAPDLSMIEQKLARNFSRTFLEKNRLLLRSMAKNILASMTESDFVVRAEAQRKAIDQVNHQSFIQHSDVRTLVLHGTEDQVIPFAVTTSFGEKFSNLTIKPFEGSGHLLIAESPARLYEEVAKFLVPEL